MISVPRDGGKAAQVGNVAVGVEVIRAGRVGQEAPQADELLQVRRIEAAGPMILFE